MPCIVNEWVEIDTKGELSNNISYSFYLFHKKRAGVGASPGTSEPFPNNTDRLIVTASLLAKK